MTDTQRSTPSLVVTANGGTEVLSVQDRPVADPGPGQLLVAVAAAGVNFVDVYQRQGIYPVPTPFVLCGEGAGTVLAVGSGVAEFAVGDRVAWAQSPGSAAGLSLVPAEVAVAVPDGLSTEVAAAAMLQGMTAHYLVNSTYPVQAGDPVLVHAAAGGVGQLLVQLAKAKGATVIGTASTEQKLAKARELGADQVINYTQVDDLAAAVRELTPDGRGVAVVYDGVGKSTFDASLASLRPRGLLALFGGASGQVPPFDLQRLNQGGSLFVTRPTMVHYLLTREELLWRGGEILGALADGSLRLEIGGRYPLTDAARAYDDLEGRRSTGKLLLIP
ncbi:MAG TPA: quinone oxidoreductase [Jatrophihabitans sp.]|nr:quinone oxidoreductase [Jatrophihabitans sp.]